MQCISANTFKLNNIKSLQSLLITLDKPTWFTVLYLEYYVGGSKIFRTDAVKIIKLTISPIGRRHPRSSSLPHVDTSPTVSSIFGTHLGSSFL